MAAITVDGHTIDVSINRLSGKEHVYYDGNDVSSKRNLRGTATHRFEVDEAGAQASYEVDTTNKAVATAVSAIRRNGKAVYPPSS